MPAGSWHRSRLPFTAAHCHGDWGCRFYDQRGGHLPENKGAIGASTQGGKALALAPVRIGRLGGMPNIACREHLYQIRVKGSLAARLSIPPRISAVAMRWGANESLTGRRNGQAGWEQGGRAAFNASPPKYQRRVPTGQQCATERPKSRLCTFGKFAIPSRKLSRLSGYRVPVSFLGIAFFAPVCGV
jgi:hypothetical protein